MYKHYGLTGKTVRIRKKKLGSLEDDFDPWAYAEQEMRIEAETPYFFICKVLPHKHPWGYGLSTPYRITIHKHDILAGDIIVNGGEIRDDWEEGQLIYAEDYGN